MSDHLRPGTESGLLPAGPIFGARFSPDDSTDGGPTIRGVLGTIRRYLWVVLLFATIGAGLAAIGVSRTETLYASRAVIQLPERSAPSAGGLGSLASSLGGGNGSINSQAHVIQSRLLLGQVVDSLGLRLHREVSGLVRSTYRPIGWVDEVWISDGIQEGVLDFEFTDETVTVSFQGREERAGYGQPVEFPGLRFIVSGDPGLGDLAIFIVDRKAAIDALLDETRALIRDGTNLIDIVATGYDPEITQKAADVTGHFYRHFTVSRAREQAERQRRFIVAQLEATEEMLRQTQDELTEFRRSQGLYSSRTQAMTDQAGRAEMEMTMAHMGAQRRTYQDLVVRLRGGDGNAKWDALRTFMVSPGVGTNPVINAAYTSLLSYQAQRDSLLMGPGALSVTNPDVRGLDAIIAASEENLIALTEGHIASLDAQIEAVALVAARDDSTFQHLAATEPEEVRLMLRMEAAGASAIELRGRSYTAGMTEAGLIEEVTILDPALPGDPTGTGPGRSILLGLLLGLLVGGASAIVLDSANQSIRRREEVERVLRVSGLGVIPPIRMVGDGKPRLRLPAVFGGAAVISPNGSGPELVAWTEVHSVGAEAFRTVRTNLNFGQFASGSRSVMITSPSNGEGKTTTAVNLAVTFAQQGRRVLLVDADLRRARLHTFFNASRGPGLAELLADGIGVDAAIRETKVRGLYLIPAGNLVQVSAADLLASDQVRTLLDKLAVDFDMVILDSPPVLLTADAPILASRVGAVLLVVRAGQTDRETAQYAVHQLAAVGAQVLGAVLNDPDGMQVGITPYTAGPYVSV